MPVGAQLSEDTCPVTGILNKVIQHLLTAQYAGAARSLSSWAAIG